METTNHSKKILGKLKLNKLSESKLEKREMKILKGGSGCHGDDSLLKTYYGGN